MNQDEAKKANSSPMGMTEFKTLSGKSYSLRTEQILQPDGTAVVEPFHSYTEPKDEVEDELLNFWQLCRLGFTRDQLKTVPVAVPDFVDDSEGKPVRVSEEERERRKNETHDLRPHGVCLYCGMTLGIPVIRRKPREFCSERKCGMGLKRFIDCLQALDRRLSKLDPFDTNLESKRAELLQEISMKLNERLTIVRKNRIVTESV